MHSLRSILLHLDASARSAERLLLARELASQLDSEITALYAAVPSYLDLPFALGDGPAGALPMLQQLDADRRSAARALFDRSNSTAMPTMHWRELEGELPIVGVVHQALVADLLVLGQYDGNDLQALGVPSDFVASVLIASGKPALVVPCAGRFETLGQRILIAWKPTREAARAVSSTIPLLQRAQHIHLSVEADPRSAADVRDLEAWLRLHDVEAKIERHANVPSEAPGEGLLSLAADVGADLLVMGCYGHSRARELVLGGASRTVLRAMTLPVLMAH